MHYHSLSDGVENFHITSDPSDDLVWKDSVGNLLNPRRDEREAIIFSLVCNAMGVAALE